MRGGGKVMIDGRERWVIVIGCRSEHVYSRLIMVFN